MSEFKTNIDFAVSFAINASRILVRHYLPAEEKGFANWCATEVMPIWKIPNIVVKSIFN